MALNSINHYLETELSIDRCWSTKHNNFFFSFNVEMHFLRFFFGSLLLFSVYCTVVFSCVSSLTFYFGLFIRLPRSSTLVNFSFFLHDQFDSDFHEINTRYDYSAKVNFLCFILFFCE